MPESSLEKCVFSRGKGRRVSNLVWLKISVTGVLNLMCV